MAISPEAKVGATTLVALIAVGAGFGWLSHFSFLGHGYDVNLNYKDVSGLASGAAIMFMGVKVGQVASVLPEGNFVRVIAHFERNDVPIPQGSHFKIFSKGIIGEKEMDIFPPAPLPSPLVVYHNGDIARGDDPPRLELAVESFTKALQHFQKSINPEQLQAIFKQTANNLLATSGSVQRITAHSEILLDQAGVTVSRLNGLIGNVDAAMRAASPADVRAIVRDLRSFTAGLNSTYAGIFGPAANSPNQKQSAQVVQNIRAIASHLDRLSGSLDETVGNPDVQSDLKGLLKNLKVLSSSLSAATSLSQPARAAFGVSPRIEGELVSHGQTVYLAGNLALRGNLLDNYYQLGIEQIGEGPYFDLGFGREHQWGQAGYEVGLIRSKLGGTLDYELQKGLTFSSEVYDPANLTFRLGGTYFPLSSAYGINGQWARTIQTGENTFWMGVEWRPLEAQPAIMGPPAP
jgi:phospholipid/cholesterol/gamma-HCH transport system substrate-binding protein